MRGKLDATHLERRALIYVRQSTPMQVHEHVESKQRQYALVERAQRLGWPREHIEVIDEDQGKSGASSDGRTGFARLAHAVGHGEAGAIFAIEVSRYARASIDWQQLLRLCAVAGVMVVDEQSIYDPADKDDRLLLDLKGTMSEAELHWLRLRLVGGRLNKARRGELWMRPPVGYVWRDGRFALDPDQAIQAAVRVVFERFAIEPTVGAVVRWARRTGFRMPTRVGDAIEWRRLTLGRVDALLHNPTYAGVYVYGRRHERSIVVDGEIRRRRQRLAPEDWPARVDGAHPAYLDWETFVNNQERLRGNQWLMHGAVPGAPKEGPALLTGLMLCGRCGRRMRVDYEAGSQRTRWRYLCVGDRGVAAPICWSLVGLTVDAAVEKLFLETMTPTELDLSIAVEREAGAQAASLEAQWRARLEQAQYEARRAERRYKAVDPDNRVVARTLERDWEARLRELEDIERQIADARRARRVELSVADREAIRAMARDLPALWRAPTTPMSDRKAMLRLVVEAVTVSPIDVPRRAARIQVQWKSGVVDERTIDRPVSRAPGASVIERMRELLTAGADDAAIAERLNAESLLSSRLEPWTASRVARARRNAGLPAPPRRAHSFLPDRHPQTGHYSAPGAARRFGVTIGVVKHWIESGLVKAHRKRFGRYVARWLVIDDATATRLDALASSRRSR